MNASDRVELERALVEKFAPTLVIFPEDRNKRPYNDERILDVEEIGDYQPCPVDLTFANFRLYRGFNLVPMRLRTGGAIRAGKGLTELERLQGLIAAGSNLADTELNLIGVDVDFPETAWDQYYRITPQRDANQVRLEEPFGHVSYARVVSSSDISTSSGTNASGPERLALQYWHFYYFNHFWNAHEFDWEMVTIILEDAGGGDWQPRRAGYSAHVSGTRREWDQVPKNPDNPNSPLVFVAAGSHAQYFGFRKQGYSVVVREVRRFPWLRRIVSWIIRSDISNLLSHRMVDVVAPAESRFFLKPKPIVVPRDTPANDALWWWVNYTGRWGEKPRRIIDLGNPDFTLLNEGPKGPWLQGDRWANPFRWVDSLESDGR